MAAVSADLRPHMVWARHIRSLTKRLNSSSATRMFEVGPSGTIIVFDIRIVAEDLDVQIDQAGDPDVGGFIRKVKPGIWMVTERITSTDPDSEGDSYVVSWVSEGPLNYESLPITPLSSSLDLHHSAWKELEFIDIDSSMGCLLTFETAQGFRDVPKGTTWAMEIYDDLSTEMLPGGFAFNSNDGGCFVDGRFHEDQVVQIRVRFD